MAIEIPEIIPTHDCTGDGCEYGSVMNFFAADDDNGGVNSSVAVHGLTTEQIAMTLVRLFDSVASENRNVPPVIAWAQGREVLRRAIENVPPPEGAHKFITDLMSGSD